MSLRLKRTVLFFCVFYLGLGGCLGNLAVAKDLWTIFITGVHNDNDVNALKRRVWGYVKDQSGSELENVGIYDHGKLLAVTEKGNGFYTAWILAGVPYTITPKKDGFIFLPQWIEIPADDDEHGYVSFKGYSSPGVVTLISPKGTTNSSTPTYEWVASSNATRFNLLVEDSTGADKINTVYTESEAGCASGSANCSVTPSTSLADGSWRWSVQACTSDLNGCGPWSNTMGFIVSAGDVTMSLDSKLDWQGTGFVVGQNMEIAIKATGTVTWMANNTSGPDGVVHLFNRVDDKFYTKLFWGKLETVRYF